MTRQWGTEADCVLDPAAGGLRRILGGPGTGKTSLLIDAATAHITVGVDAQSVLFLTGSGCVAGHIRHALTAALLTARPAAGTGLPPVVREPLVRTVHSYAFAVLRMSALRGGCPPPRLVTAAEQEGVIQELLAGDDPDAWPESLHGALRTEGFASELRNFLGRCAERDVNPEHLAWLGERHNRPEWSAAGRFARQYEQVMLLRAAAGTAAPQATVPALGAAELVGAALDAFAAEPDLLAAEHARIRVLLVDDAQQLDPQAARLVRLLARGTALTLIAGDPDQAVFGFRGAAPVALGDSGGWCPPDGGSEPAQWAASTMLTRSYRCAPAVTRAIGGVAGRLPGAGVARRLCAAGADTGSVAVRLAASDHAEDALIADGLRRAHLVDGVPWSQMAVIVRSLPRAGERLPRALAAAGVPVVLPAAGGSLAEQPAVAALLTVLAATADGLDGRQALHLLTGPIGRVDPVSLRQLRRTLRRAEAGPPGSPADAGDVFVAALAPAGGSRPRVGDARALRRVRAVLDVAARCHRDGQDPRYTLWQAWHRSGLQQRWLTLSERGGQSGAQADRDLDAVTALFDVAEQYVSRTAGASLRGLVDHVTALRLGAPGAEPAPGTEAVSVLSAHAALGQEWDLVVVAGLQEGLWPNTVPRGGVLHTQRLFDLLDGVGEGASARAPLLAEERRLLVAAMGRARRRLLVTAVDGAAAGGDQIPSEFFTELARWTTGADGPGEASTPVAAPQVLSAAAVVGRLRGVVCAPAGAVDDNERAGAATQLARLAEAGVPGADPAEWYGIAAVSTDAPLRRGDSDVVTLSPSTLQTLTDCPLRWMVEQHGGTDGRDLRSAIGSLLHALIAGPVESESRLLAELDRKWQQLPFESQWYSDNELERHRAMLQEFMRWREQTRHQLTEVAVEADFDGMIDGVRLCGRVDRIERDAGGRLVVVDVKTGRTPVSKDDAQRHAQLAAYQLAVDAGLVPGGDEAGGARLVYPGKPGAAGATEREQDALTAETRDEWRRLVAAAAAGAAGPRFVARVNDGCRHCPIRSSCPAYAEGTGR